MISRSADLSRDDALTVLAITDARMRSRPQDVAVLLRGFITDAVNEGHSQTDALIMLFGSAIMWIDELAKAIDSEDPHGVMRSLRERVLES